MSGKKSNKAADLRLAEAVENGDLEAATAALDAGADVNMRHLACEFLDSWPTPARLRRAELSKLPASAKPWRRRVNCQL